MPTSPTDRESPMRFRAFSLRKAWGGFGRGWVSPPNDFDVLDASASITAAAFYATEYPMRFRKIISPGFAWGGFGRGWVSPPNDFDVLDASASITAVACYATVVYMKYL